MYIHSCMSHVVWTRYSSVFILIHSFICRKCINHVRWQFTPQYNNILQELRKSLVYTNTWCVFCCVDFGSFTNSASTRSAGRRHAIRVLLLGELQRHRAGSRWCCLWVSGMCFWFSCSYHCVAKLWHVLIKWTYMWSLLRAYSPATTNWHQRGFIIRLVDW